MLQRGIIHRAQIDLLFTKPAWVQDKAKGILENPAPVVEKALPSWINRLVADTSNSTKIFKMIGAHRRGLLHLDRPHRWGYPNNWPDVSERLGFLTTSRVSRVAQPELSCMFIT